MKNVRVDSDGDLRCWNCGNKGLLPKRTFRAKLLVGVGALLTKKKLKCQTCGEYNDTGNAKPFTGPEGRKWRKAWEKEQARKSATQRAAEERAAIVATEALLAQAAQAERGGIRDEDELGAVATRPLAPSTNQMTPAAWMRDPTGRHELRYWDGSAWTAHVADGGVQASDSPT